MARDLRYTTLALAALLPAAGCLREQAPQGGEVRQVMQDFTMTQTREGRRRWSLSAPRARITMEGSAKVDEPVILFYRAGEEGHATTARARHAEVDGETQDVRLLGDVVITAHKENTTLRTERLDYGTADEKFRTEERVLVERPGARLRGRGLVADSTLNDITIFKQETVIE